MKKIILMVMLSALVSVSFAQQRKTQAKRTVTNTVTSNKVVEQLNDSIIILNDKIKELNDRVKDLQKRLNVEVISELTGKDGTIYRIINCDYDYNYKVLTIEFQIVNHIDDQDLKFVGTVASLSPNKITAIVDGYTYQNAAIYFGDLAGQARFILDKDVVKNISFKFFNIKKLPKTINSFRIYEGNSDSELHFKELPIKRNL